MSLFDHCWLHRILLCLPFVAFLFYIPLLIEIAGTTTPPPSPSIRADASNQTSSEKRVQSNQTSSQVQAAENKSSSLSRPHPHAGARYPNGTLGYVADPTALRRGVQDFLKSKRKDNEYWDLLQHYQSDFRNGTETGTEILSPDYICAMGPGRGFEQDGGYKLLAEKIKIHNATTHKSSPRILCAIYTYPRMNDLLRTMALSWGYKCDGFLAFSTQSVPELGLVDLLHEGDESYDNMWQKSRSIWSYIHDHYLNDYDFFHLGGDDLYMIVENFRRFLAGVMSKQTNNNTPIYLGEWHGLNPDPAGRYMVTGRAGYTLNQVALERIVTESFPECKPRLRAANEDRIMTFCFRGLGIAGGDTRDEATGQQQYHGVDPNTLFTMRSGGKTYHSRQIEYWEKLPHPNGSAVPVGPKPELEAAATYSVSLHDIYHPLFAARLHGLLYKKTCPADSTLGRALRIHCIDD